MKKFLILFLITIQLFSFIQLESSARVNNTKNLSKIENELFGFDYTNDSELNRVIRLEKNIYGKEFSGDINKRLNKIRKRDLNSNKKTKAGKAKEKE